jgi:hypothetical protein
VDAKIQEVSQGNKDRKELAEEAKKLFNGISTKERVEFSFQRWLTGSDAKEGSGQGRWACVTGSKSD